MLTKREKTNIPKYLHPRVNVLQVRISLTNMAETLATIKSWVERGEQHYVCVTTVHGVMECQMDENLKRIYNASGLTVPDGMPLVWIGRLQGFSRMGRVYGPDLMLEVCKMSLKKGYTHFLYGGDVGVVEELKKSLTQKFPGLKILGTYTPPFRPLNRAEEGQLIEEVASLKPDFFWVGLGTPKQERFMGEYLPKLDTRVMLGVGAAFDFHTDRLKEAPAWMKKTGLQWLHRLSNEPKRLWKRYILNNPLFVFKFILQLASRKKLSGGSH